MGIGAASRYLGRAGRPRVEGDFGRAPLRRRRPGWLSAYCLGATLFAAAAPLGALGLLVVQSLPLWEAKGSGLLTGAEWRYREGLFGALPMVYGTAAVSLIALALAGPLGVGAAVFTSECLPRRFRFLAKSAIELLAGVPSVVYGLLAVAFLRGWVAQAAEPWGAYTGDTLLTAGLVLGAMILPTIATLSDDALGGVSPAQRASARALGLTRAETILRVALPQAGPGLVAAAFLGLGRAIGETMAVFLVVGRMDNQIPENVFSPAAWLQPGQTLTSKLGGPETQLALGDPVHWGAMLGLALLLLALVGLCLAAGRGAWALWGRGKRRASEVARGAPRRWRRPDLASCEPPMPPAARQWRLSFRRRVGRRAVSAAAALSGLSSVALMLAIGGVIAVKGAGSLSWEFLTALMREAGAAGGVAYQIVGTLILVATAAAVAAPLALGVAVTRVALLRARPRLGRLIDDALQLLNGVPSVVFGVVGLLFFMGYLGWGKSWLAGGVLLGFMILPAATVALVERMAAVSRAQIEAAAALGLRRDQIVRAVWLPQSWGGLFSGLLIGLARAAGETAPILFVAAVFSGATLPRSVTDAPVAALPYHIFTLAQDSIDARAQANLWGAALTLLFIVAALNLAALSLRRRLHEASSPA